MESSVGISPLPAGTGERETVRKSTPGIMLRNRKLLLSLYSTFYFFTITDSQIKRPSISYF